MPGNSVEFFLKLSIGDFVAGIKTARNQFGRSTAAMKGDQQKLNAAFSALGVKPFQQTQREIQKLQAAYNRLARSGSVSVRDLAQAQLRLRSRIRGLNDEVNGFGRQLGNIQGQLIGFAAGIAGAFAAAGSVIEADTSFEGFTNALTAATGSADSAGESIQFLRQEAERLGLPLQTLIGSFTGLAASAKGTALEGSKTRDIFTAVAEASSVMKLSADQTQGALTAVSQIMSKGVVSAEELRGQLGDRLPGAFQIAARAIGVSTAELGKMLEQGKLLSEDFLPAFAEELRKSVAEGLPDSVDSATAAFNRLGNALFELRAGIAEAGLLDVVAAIARALTALVEGFGELTPVTKAYIGVLTAGLGAFILWRVSLKAIAGALLDLMIPALTGATAATGAFALALRAIPFIGIGLALFELGRALLEYGDASDEARIKTQGLSGDMKRLKASLEGLERVRIEILIDARTEQIDFLKTKLQELKQQQQQAPTFKQFDQLAQDIKKAEFALKSARQELGILRQSISEENSAAELGKQFEEAAKKIGSAFKSIRQSARALTDSLKTEYQRQLQDIDQRLQEELRLIEADGGADVEAQRTEAIIATNEERLQAARDFADERLVLIEELGAKEKDAGIVPSFVPRLKANRTSTESPGCSSSIARKLDIPKTPPWLFGSPSRFCGRKSTNSVSSDVAMPGTRSIATSVATWELNVLLISGASGVSDPLTV